MTRHRVKLVAFGGFEIKPIGQVELEVESNSVFDIVKFLVVKGKCSPILGLKTCIDLKLIKRIDSVESAVPSTSMNTKNEKINIYNENKSVFEGIGCFPDLCKIKIKDNAEPYISSARRIPFKLKNKFEETLKLLESRSIIKSVNEPVEWVSNIVIVEKPNGSLRVCIDPNQLNKYIIRERYTIPTLEELALNLANKKFYSVIDIKDGFYHILLDEESSKLCAFSTVFGTYRFLRAPFGLSCLPELFQKLMVKYFGDIKGVTIYFDDLCIATDTKEENDRIIKQVIERAKQYNIKFNFAKFQYCQDKVKYLGMMFSKQGMVPDPSKTEIIKNIPDPKNKTELQRFMGMVNYLRNFIPNLSKLESPLRELLKKNKEWVWESNHVKAISDIKNALCSEHVLAPFDPSLPITIQCDASADSLGSCLLQNDKPICFSSRSLTNTEIEYAQIEKELLAIYFACEKYRNYIYGHSNVVIFSDHMPLLSIIEKPLCKIQNNRIRRIKIKLMTYTFKLKYLPGRLMYVADFLSRTGITTRSTDDVSMKDVVHCIEATNVNFSKERFEEFVKETRNDETLSKVINYCNNGWPSSKLTEDVSHFHKLKDDIIINDDLVYYEDRLIVPRKLRKFIIFLLHETHLGINKTLDTAKTFFYWPAMSSDIKNTISSCDICQKYQRSKIKEPLKPHDIPQFPFMKIAMDIAEHNGINYLVVIDFYSRWIELVKLYNKTSVSIINKLKDIFCRFGIPKIVVADNQPFGSYEFREFAKSWNFVVENSSPHYPKSNGLAEKAVGIVKNMLSKSKEERQDIELYLLNYRNAPVAKLSCTPSQLLNSRILRSKIPVSDFHLRPKLVPDSVHSCMMKNKEMQKQIYDKTSTSDSDKFLEGEEVLVQDVNSKTWLPGQITKVLSQPRSYLVKQNNERIIRRNSIHIRHKPKPK